MKLLSTQMAMPLPVIALRRTNIICCPATRIPTVHVDEKSEDGWLFVKLEKENNFDDFMTYQMAAGWIELENGVYYCTVTSDTADQTFGVILDDTVNVKQTVTKGQLNALTDNILPKMSVTA